MVHSALVNATPNDVKHGQRSNHRNIPRERRQILGMRVDATSYRQAADQVMHWASDGESRYVSVASVHTVMEAHDSPTFQRIVNQSDLVTPDGMPLVWGLRLLGVPSASRVYGPDLTPVVCRQAADEGIPVGFYGGAPAVVARMIDNLTARYPRLPIIYHHSLPFRPLQPEEAAQEIKDIRASGARILFVGLGCPKQERWMAERRGAIPAVMLGVGAAFDFLAGTKAQAPATVQAMGLEWLFRMATEPRRPWRRYLYNNPRFVGLFAAQLLLSERRGTP
jgi:N-acetylglucosaminyldiphosphoundecaprenol N-acetyl-beta-D-mannosaminyltransferase